MDLWSRLDGVQARWNVREHPFSQRWRAGELSREDLARYAGQYRHAVVALAAAADHAAHAGGLADRAWADEDRDLLGHLVALYAIESAQPEIARVKADGLRAHYGFAPGPATAYFDLHTERVLQANWLLLDGVERLCGR